MTRVLAPWRSVISAERQRGPHQGAHWLLECKCGHRLARATEIAPRRVRCHPCALEGRT